MYFVYAYFFIVGITFGSFFNVVGLRVPKKESIVYPRSFCPKCQAQLKWFELIPILSFFILKGKCRNCRTKISILYPLMELITGLLFVFSFYQIGFQGELIVAFTLVSLLIIITVSDLAYQIIPNKVLLCFAIILFIERLIFPLSPWYDFLLGALTGFLLLYIIALLSKGGMGGGDIKLYFVIGLVLGVKGVLLAFFVSTLIGALFSVFGILIGKLHRKSAIPFGPFISFGAIVTYFYGQELLEWYIHLLQ